MKKVALTLMALLALVMQFCSSSKKAAHTKEVAKMTYIGNIEPIISTSCSPCHIPPKGNKKPYNSYAAVSSDISDIIARISKNPGEKGFMPMRHPKLSSDTINVFVQWKNDGLLEK
jgi:hypothetical protein